MLTRLTNHVTWPIDRRVYKQNHYCTACKFYHNTDLVYVIILAWSPCVLYVNASLHSVRVLPTLYKVNGLKNSLLCSTRAFPTLYKDIYASIVAATVTVGRSVFIWILYYTMSALSALSFCLGDRIFVFRLSIEY